MFDHAEFVLLGMGQMPVLCLVNGVRRAVKFAVATENAAVMPAIKFQTIGGLGEANGTCRADLFAFAATFTGFRIKLDLATEAFGSWRRLERERVCEGPLYQIVRE
nr:hypothetical protein [uncultured Cohaesibacter sp.]